MTSTKYDATSIRLSKNQSSSTQSGNKVKEDSGDRRQLKDHCTQDNRRNQNCNYGRKAASMRGRGGKGSGDDPSGSDNDWSEDRYDDIYNPNKTNQL